MPTIEKVTAFVTRETPHGRDLLLFEHPYAGIQIPAGTVEPGEAIAAAALREAFEETGLTGLQLVRALGQRDDPLPADSVTILRAVTAYARPDATSFDWVTIRRGIGVKRTGRTADGFVQITYSEHDDALDPHYLSFQITGWVPEDALADRQIRHYFLLSHSGDTPPRWTVATDNHRFTLFWSPLAALPPIVPPQASWLDLLPDDVRGG